MSITLEVRLENLTEPIGYLTAGDDKATSFSYLDSYLALSNSIPLSIALPLTPIPFNDVETRTFFDNLLPENNQLQQTMDRENLSRDDIVGLLFHLGSDCPGAISCIPLGEAPVKVPGDLNADYDELIENDLTEIVRRLADREPLPNKFRDQSPIAGVQRKIAITVLANGGFGLPKPGLRVPTTHILKVPRRGKGREARLETAAAQLGQACGLMVAQPQVIQIDDIEALLVSRFDRRVFNGRVTRVHQEDFAQALGLPASFKYQRYGKDGRRFDAIAIAELLNKTAEPAVAVAEFLRSTVFNLAIGNTDNHAKNHALIYDLGTAPRLAPLYDLLPVRLDPDVRPDLAFNIGTASQLNDIDIDAFVSFISSFGLSKNAIRRFISDSIVPMLKTLDQASIGLTSEGLKDFDDLIGRELSQLIKAIHVDFPTRDRDHYESRGGGWKMSS